MNRLNNPRALTNVCGYWINITAEKIASEETSRCLVYARGAADSIVVNSAVHSCMPPTLRLLAVFVLFLYTASGPASAASSVNPGFQTRPIRIAMDMRTTTLQVELATTAKQHAVGLMGRAHLPPNQGMLFLFSEPQAATSAFWMFHTLIPLDVAFLNAKGRILAIQGMTPCKSPDPRRCPVYPAFVSYSAALEVNKDYFARHDISIGDRVLLPARTAQTN